MSTDLPDELEPAESTHSRGADDEQAGRPGIFDGIDEGLDRLGGAIKLLSDQMDVIAGERCDLLSALQEYERAYQLSRYCAGIEAEEAHHRERLLQASLKARILIERVSPGWEAFDKPKK